MSNALETSARALGAAAGDAADTELIRTARIGVWCDGGPGGLLPESAALVAEALGELLGRFWHAIDAEGAGAGDLVASARSASAACAYGSDIRRKWDPPYDFAIGIGAGPPPACAADSVAVGAAGWTATAGSAATLGADANPAGPLASAALASAEALKSVFSIGARRGAARLPDPYKWDTCPRAAASWAPEAGAELDVGEAHVFGVGAVTHALLWLLCRWPGGATGVLHLVDPDAYDSGNPQRYLGTTADDAGRPKASAAADRVRRACPNLDVVAHDTDMNDYFATCNPECRVRTAVCGLDSKEGRRQLGLKLPLTTVNMWTSGFHAGASTFSLDDGWPCMLCAYPEPAGAAPADEASSICRELGLAPRRIRELLDSGRSIDESDAEIIGATIGAAAGTILLKPIRSVRAEMCATGSVAARLGRSEVDMQVPLAPASAMSGAAGFVELARAARGAKRHPNQFQTSVLKYPTPHSWARRGPSPGCRFCTPAIRQLACVKYARRLNAGAAAR